MEAIAELIGAIVIAFVHALAGLLWGIGALLAAVVEFLFLALTQGLSSASQKYEQRKTERKSRLTATESEADTEATGRIPSISRKQSAVIAALVIRALDAMRDRVEQLFPGDDGEAQPKDIDIGER